MMNFIAIDSHAVRKIVSERNLQSADYEKGRLLSQLLKNSEITDFSHEIKAKKSASGIYLLSKIEHKKNFLVFDLTTFSGFNKTQNEIITILQKTCRLAIKLWDGISHSPCEKMINNTSLIALLPFSFTTGKSYKVILDKAPEKERQEKRNESSFLVFQDGYDTCSTSPKLSNFRKAKDEITTVDINELFKTIQDEGQAANYLSCSEIDTNGFKSNPHMGLDYWRQNLTESQRNFVFSHSYGPDILKGAAGTGKTLSLTLRCVVQLKRAEEQGKPLKAIFITHSIATKNNIQNLIATNGGSHFIDSEKEQSILVTTLQEWCINNLGSRISETEYLDCDAFESKQMQLLYINEAVEDYIRDDYKGAIPFISDKLNRFLSGNDSWTLTILLQEEISTYIKGRAGDDFKTYYKLNRSKLAIPLDTEDDFKTIYSIYLRYQQKLIALNLFDSDDITLSALNETSTPIWKRRRMTSGFDVMYIDETHLFNINELSLFHNLLKTNSNNIVFTMDRSQAPGDTAITKNELVDELRVETNNEHGFSAVFRSSDQIINLASCVLASGALLFRDIENPLFESMSGSTALVDNVCLTPYLVKKQNMHEAFKATFNIANHMSAKYNIKRSEILVVPCSDQILKQMKEYCADNAISHLIIERRGDDLSQQAEQSNKYIIGGIDYVGGLEFSAVIIVGADADKFPEQSRGSCESNHFINYSSFNKLYVAITRAKYQVAFVCEKTQKITPLLEAAFEEGLLVEDSELALIV